MKLRGGWVVPTRADWWLWFDLAGFWLPQAYGKAWWLIEGWRPRR